MSTGTDFEKLVKRSVESLSDFGLHLNQTSPRFVADSVDEQGRAKGRLVGVGMLDFVGDYQGIYLTFDCKSSVHKRLDLDLIRQHQAVIVRKAEERGACAFFLLEIDSQGDPRYFAVTWPVLKPFWRGLDLPDAPQSLSLQVLEEQAIEVKRDKGRLDLMGLLDRLGVVDRAA